MRVVLLGSVIDDGVPVSKLLLVFQCLLDGLVAHNEHRICPFSARLVVALGHAAEVFSERCLPRLRRRRIVHQFFITRNGFTGNGVHHRQTEVFHVRRRG